jgi:hypothetical protein
MRKIPFLAVLLLGFMPLTASAQIAYSEDFEGEFPGPGQPAAVAYTYGGVGSGTDPFNPTFPQEISTDGLGEFQQAYKISFDTSAAADYYFFGLGMFAGFFGPEFRAGGGVEGGTDPGNWVFSADVRSQGALGDVALRGNFVVYDPDYETTFSVDVNSDGDMVDGFDTYILPITLIDNGDGFTTNSFRLDAGTPTSSVAGDIPRFFDDATWVIQLFGGGGEYPYAAGNSITLDNLKIEFSEKPAAPGDYNNDGVVNLADYTVWRDNLGATVTLPNEGTDITPGEVTAEDYAFWKSQFGNTAGTLMSSVNVPEPGSVVLALLAMAASLSACRRHRG